MVPLINNTPVNTIQIRVDEDLVSGIPASDTSDMFKAAFYCTMGAHLHKFRTHCNKCCSKKTWALAFQQPIYQTLKDRDIGELPQM